MPVLSVSHRSQLRTLPPSSLIKYQQQRGRGLEREALFLFVFHSKDQNGVWEICTLFYPKSTIFSAPGCVPFSYPCVRLTPKRGGQCKDRVGSEFKLPSIDSGTDGSSSEWRKEIFSTPTLLESKSVQKSHFARSPGGPGGKSRKIKKFH